MFLQALYKMIFDIEKLIGLPVKIDACVRTAVYIGKVIIIDINNENITNSII